ncbi:hypothetical protein OAG1_15870 [Agarivorans sp. OAG1]|uniref:hypothetical protein n=1 Tax=unclassified Agarivorans TaxID=2636026 RepID=UPI002B323FAF|nr:hypothetical protein OAG1_15870 [Agarivorans sp. OAG1]
METSTSKAIYDEIVYGNKDKAKSKITLLILNDGDGDGEAANELYQMTQISGTTYTCPWVALENEFSAKYFEINATQTKILMKSICLAYNALCESC